MQKDWVQYFKDRAAAIITQSFDSCAQVAAFMPLMDSITPTSITFQRLGSDMSEEQLRAAWEANGMLAAHETMDLLARVMHNR